ncbi:MAG: hypothetical protein RIC16_02985 [Rhodospirillales bacterium]
MNEARVTSQAALERACARLSDALERIVDGLDNMPGGDQRSNADVAEVETLRIRVASLEGEIKALREVGRNAAEGINETIAALDAVRR